MHTVSASAAKAAAVRRIRLGAAPSVSLPARRSIIRRFKEDVAEAPTSEKVKVSFKVPHHVEFGENICVVGAHDTLGSWDVGSSVPLNWSEGDVWTAQLELPLDTGAVEYKYIIKSEQKIKWMPCNNLVLEVPGAIAEVSIEDNWHGTTHDVIIPEVQSEAEPEAPAKVEQQEQPKAAKAESKAETPVAAAKTIEKTVEKPSAKATTTTTEASTKPAAAQAPEAKVVSDTAAAVKEAVAAGASAAAKDTAKSRKQASPSAPSSNGNGSAANKNRSGFSRLFK